MVFILPALSLYPQVAQVVAHTLQVPLDLVVVKGSDTFIGANSMVTGGSIGSDLCAHVSLISHYYAVIITMV